MTIIWRAVTSILFASVAIRSTAHFILEYPDNVGFDDDIEAEAPCGGFTVDFSKDNVTDFHVGGDSIVMLSTHPEAVWLFRGTVNNTGTGGWQNLLPSVKQTGIGDFCEQDVVVPSSWAGSQGVLQVVQNGPDGVLYQCAAVKYVTGTGTVPSACRNVSGLTATYTSDAVLSSLPASSTSTPTSDASPSSSTSTTPNAAASVDRFNGALGSVLLAFFIAIVSALAFAL